MKQNILTLATAVTCLLLAGCAGREPEAVAYLALKSTQLAVDGAERAYGDAVVRGRVPVDKQQDADAAIVKFHTAFRLAVVTARGDLRAPTPENLQQHADALISLLLAFSDPQL